METATTARKNLRVRGAWVEVSSDALAQNIRAAQDVLSETTALMFVVKANAYGHGLIPVARRAAEAGVKWFAVAYLEEALAVRQALPHVNILVIGVVDEEDVPVLLEQRIVPIVVTAEHGAALARAASALEGTLPVHLKVDTGMGRLGVAWQEASSVLRRLCATPGLDVQGLCSHFAAVEPHRPDTAQAQYERFALVADASPKKLFKHISSSRAFLYHGEWDLDAVRPGIALYGYGTAEEGMRIGCRPILQWKTTVMQVKSVPGEFPVGYYGTYVTPAPTRLGIIAMGYADGYLRALSNRGHVLIRGCRHKVVGRVTMNWLTVDLGPDSEVQPGDEVVLIGEQGGESIWASELARECRTIPYEILTMINPSIPRHYVAESPAV